MGNTGSVGANRVESTDLRQSLSVCLACHKNLFHEKYTERTTEIKMHVKRFLQSVYNTNEATVFDWVTWDRDTADIVVPDDATWVEDGGVLVPLHLQGLREAFDVVVSVFCPTMVLPSRDVAFAYKLLKPNGLFVVMGSGSPEAFVQNVVSARARTGVIPPIESECPSTPVPIYYHQGTRSNGIDSFGVFQKYPSQKVFDINKRLTMENVIVEPATGDVGVSTLIKAAMPELHAGSVLRSVHNVLKKPDAVGLDLTTKTVNGRMTRMASLEICNYILDNMPGHRWTVWRTSQGDSFKESLAQRVSQARESCSEEVSGEVQNEPQGEEEVQEELQETKESTMKKALRTLDIDGSVRIDEASGKASIIDVIKLLSPGVSRDSARKMLSCLLEKEDANDTNEAGNSVPFADRVSHIKINGAGHVTPVSDAKTIVEIIWLLPARAARSFRRQSAEVICRVLGGDVSLCGEIEERCARLESTPSGRSYQEFMMGGADDQQPEAKRTRIGPKIMELASEEEYAQYVKLGLKTEMVKTEVSLVMSLKEAFEEITPLQERHKIELCDRISDIQKRAFRAVDTSREALPAIANSPVNVDAVVMAAPLTTQDPGHDIPTPQCSPEVRGEEVSIAMIATEMGVSVRGRGGQIGKKLKALYAQRYGSIAANELPKRHTIFQGRPYFENSYYARDRDLVQQAITTVVT